MNKKKEGDLVSNRKALHDYFILETYEAGICLLGTEVKSLRAHGGSLQDAYVDLKKEEPYLVGASIAPYHFGNLHNHEERRARKLLLHKKEIEKLRKQIVEKGLTLIALSIYTNSKGLIKVKLGLAKGKKLHDVRQSVKERDVKRSLQKGSFED